MTRDAIAAKVAQNLDDAGSVHFTAQDINDSIQDGYDQIALRTGCIEKVTTVNWVANQVFYNFSSLISDYYRVFMIYNQRTKKWIKGVSWRELRDISYKWATLNGESFQWAPMGFSHIAVSRVPTASDSTNPMLVMYSAQAPTLVGDTVPDFPTDYHTALVEYATGDLLDQDLEYSKAVKYMSNFE